MKKYVWLSCCLLALLLCLSSCRAWSSLSDLWGGESEEQDPVPGDENSENENGGEPEEEEQENGKAEERKPIVPSMNSTNYWDVSDFCLQKTNYWTVEQTILQFSYVTILLREGTEYQNQAFWGDYQFNQDNIENMLKTLWETCPLQVMAIPQAEYSEMVTAFAQEYGVAYSISFTHNIERYGEDRNYEPCQWLEYTFWISSKTANETYYVLSEAEYCIFECTAEDLAFLTWPSSNWIVE